MSEKENVLSADELEVERKKLRDFILEEYKSGKIVVATFEGLASMPIAEFIKQPADGILYDLNRSEEIVMTLLSDPKWVNDFAVAKTIRYLKDLLDASQSVAASES